MRAQIRGLETAQKNAQDGISVIQTAEGALTEVHSILNRMVELATQAANGIYGTEEAKDGMTLPSDLVTNAGQKGMVLQVGDTAGQRIEVVIKDMDPETLLTQSTRPDTTVFDPADPLTWVDYDADLDGVFVGNVDTANKSIAVIKTAINTVSTQRAAFGALQNVLQQAAVAMLAQAQQSPESVLQLLR
jgi:flagellin